MEVRLIRRNTVSILDARVRSVTSRRNARHISLQIRLQGSPTPDVTGPTMETSSKRISKADRVWNTLDSKILEHLVKTKMLC